MISVNQDPGNNMTILEQQVKTAAGRETGKQTGTNTACRTTTRCSSLRPVARIVDSTLGSAVRSLRRIWALTGREWALLLVVVSHLRAGLVVWLLRR